MQHNTPQVIIDLEEYQSLKKRIEELSAPGIGEELSSMEYQEAAGRLLYIALNNPGIFRSNKEIDLGKYKAVVSTITNSPSTTKTNEIQTYRNTTVTLVKFSRT